MSQLSRVSRVFGSVSSQQQSVEYLSGSGALGALDTVNEMCFINATGAATCTLPAGSVGQVKTVCLTAHGGNVVLTPSSMVGVSTVTFTAAGQAVTLVYSGSAWIVRSNNATTIA